MALLERAIGNTYKAIANSDAFLLFLSNKKDHVSVNGLDFIFHYYDTTVNNTSTNPPRMEKRDRLMPPYEPHIELGHYTDNGTCHYLILNRYQFCPGHLIMALDTSAELQGSPLMKHDYSMFSKILSEVDDRGVAYYNGGVEAGCTQYHKHFQYIPNQYNPLFDKMAQGYQLPYRYFTEKLSDYRTETIGDAYKKLVEKMDHNGSYNFIISKKVAAIVPRRRAKHTTGCLVNSMGVMGHLYVGKNNALEAKKDPIGILRHCCIPVE